MIKINEVVPDFEFAAYHKDEDTKMKLSQFKDKWKVLIFYPADFTFICPTELEEAADHYAEFQKIGAEVISFSTDNVNTHKAWHDTSPAIGKVEYPMGADPSGKICRMFGTYIEDGDDEGLSLRGTFIIDPDNVLRSMEINANNIGRSTAELLRKLQAAKFVRENKGKVCPASWKPGDDTLQPGMDLVGKI